MRRLARILHASEEGLLDAAYIQARDRKLLRRLAEGAARDALLFCRPHPSASVGRHQASARELRLDYCRRAGIAVVRRPTGGGALYLDPGQLLFSLVVRPPPAWGRLRLEQLLALTAGLVARALRACGAATAAVRAPNDVEVDGAKLASVHAAREGCALLVQGTVLIEPDIERALEALRVPTEKLTADGLAAARERYAPLAALLGRAPPPGELESALAVEFAQALRARLRWHAAAHGARPLPSHALRREALLVRALSWEHERPGVLETITRSARGATLRAQGRFSADGARLEHVEIATDAHLEPAHFLDELCAALRGAPADRVAEKARELTARRAPDLCGLAPEDLERALGELAAKHDLCRRRGLSAREANALMFACAGPRPDLERLLGRAQAMLVPYCAKPAWCKFRHRDGCSECGLCEVGEAYRLARSRGMPVTTVTSYEHLLATLERLKAQGVRCYIGMCCGYFFVKRHRAFAAAGMEAVLMEVKGANCYELKQEREAYAGTFRAQARLDARLLARLAPLLPPESSGGEEMR